MNNIDLSNIMFAAYGSLRVDAYNFCALLDAVPVVKQATTLSGYRMVSFGAFPAVYHTGNPEDKIVVDLFKFNPDVDSDMDTLGWVHGMELGAGYDLTTDTTDTGEPVFLYKMDRVRDSDYEEVEDGDWMAYKGAAA